MDQSLTASHRGLLSALAAATRKLRAVGGIDRAAFVRAYYANVDPQDLGERAASDLAGAALSHLRFARQRRGRPLVRVFNPSVEQDGYSSPHTVVEVVIDDMPFLVDSVGMVLARRGLTVHFLAHPVLAVVRDRGGSLRQVMRRDAQGAAARGGLESFQHVEVDRIVDAGEMRAMAAEILSSLEDVRVVNADWRAMRVQARSVAADFENVAPRIDAAEAAETRALLAWMENRHFIFVGYREYRLRGTAGKERLIMLEDTGLGILRPGRDRPAVVGHIASRDIRRQARSSEIALVTKANSQSTVHRRGYLDYVGVKQYDRAGRLIGERRFLGLWTSAAYTTPPRDIPVLRRKVARVIDHFGMAPDSHDGRALLRIMEQFPRDELFQAALPELVSLAAGVFGLQERPRVRILMRRDPFRRFYSCLVFVPRDKYNTQVRQRVEKVVRDALAATSVDSQVEISESNLARVYIVAHTLPANEVHIDLPQLERNIEAAVRSWTDSFRVALLARHDESRALQLFARYAHAFPAAYTEDFDGSIATRDVEFLEALESRPQALHLDLYRLEGRGSGRLFLKIFRKQDAIAISDVLPLLENMGMKVIAERPYELELAPGRRAWIQDLEIEQRVTPVLKFERLEGEIKSAFTAIWTRAADNDSFNQLTLSAGLPWRQVMIIRAYARFLLQAGLPFSQGYMAQVLINHSGLTHLLAELFAARFTPGLSAGTRAGAQKRLNARIHAKLEAVTRSDEDRILRAYWNALRATVRTNAFQPDAQGQPRDYLSFKIESQQLPELPLPKPMFEIFVFSPRMEGVHLRMGKVARGGIRWSDRREDFRTEILGLMKAQNVKNTVIVPVGAKGGFVVKQMPAGDRDAQQREVIACYQWLIRGLLDITDNIVRDKLVPPASVVRHDEDDPYLVVAADKGTASFSDIANAISEEYGFWLGDAFASGGSAGYDHKKMAITARGAWECVKRHFREIGVDTQSQDFTVAGIGDMAGDVFGNGMLQSRHIRLLAAFNHQHIFLDPDPDAARSYAERARLFKLPRSSWEDYSAKLISRGGGVFSRAAKTLSLSRECQTMLELPGTAAPNEVIRAILRMRVDLLWNGGIGTYVKAAHESHAEVGDRSNDAVRVDGRSLRCKVIGEGGNLGCSQLGRVEYARAGGRLNTDFIDNSAGVNCSDVEVNLKILLNAAMHDGELTRAARNRLLVRMTDEVAGLVLRNNYLQSQAISTIGLRAVQRLGEYAFVIKALERAGDLNRALEYLPSDEEIAERRKAGEGLTRPELAITLSYSKIWLYRALIQTDVPEDPFLSGELDRYFPAAIQEKFAARIRRHRLRREIIATAITNSLINRMGPVFAIRAREDSGASAADIARAYSIAREVFAARDLWLRIEALDNRMSADAQYSVMLDISRLLRQATYWFLSNRRRNLDIEASVRRYSPKIDELYREIASNLGESEKTQHAARRKRLVADGVPEALAARLSVIEPLHAALDLAEVATDARLPVTFAARAYYEMGERLGLSWLRQQIESLAVEGQWQAVARASLRDNLYALHRRLTAKVLGESGSKPEVRLERWMRRHPAEIDALKRVLVDMRTSATPDFATLSVALQSVRRIGGDPA
ncbi:MAG: NAD-glutamate dehydrogenase [Steroidobacteraceae bacterium]